MGIVVSFAMLLGAVFLLFERFYKTLNSSRFVQVALAFIALAGLWNSLWYGLPNIDTFWGVAGFVSGVFILMSALFVYEGGFSHSTMTPFTLQLIRGLLIVGLLLCLVLYAVTIVRINLGLPIIR